MSTSSKRNAVPPVLTMATALTCLSEADRQAFARHCRALLDEILADMPRGMAAGAMHNVSLWADRTELEPEGAREADDLLAVTMWAISGSLPFFEAGPVEDWRPDLRLGSAAEQALERELWADLATAAGADPAVARVVGSLAPAWPGDTAADWLDLLATASSAASR